MGARIQISVEEYNSLKEKIEKLEKENVEKDKDIEVLVHNIGKYEDIIEYVFNEITPIERIFQWKYVVKAVNDALGK